VHLFKQIYLSGLPECLSPKISDYFIILQIHLTIPVMICTSDPNILISSLVFSEKADKMCILVNEKKQKKQV